MEAGALPPQRPRSLAVLSPIALAIPVFFVAMGAELALCWRRGRLSGERPAWRLVDAVVAAGLYVAVYDAAALFVLPGENPGSGSAPSSASTSSTTGGTGRVTA